MSENDRRQIVVTRTFPVPRAEVFRAWTVPSELEWFLNPEQPRPDQQIEVDLRVGGAWTLPMVIDAETSYTTGGIYLEIVPDERLVFAWGAEEGWPKLDRSDLRAGPVATIVFEDVDATSSRATMTLALPDAMPDDEVEQWLAKGIGNGWRMTVERLTLPA
ncbi:SRPBCC family protein [Microbacterium aoyamense]|uniref:SRPBCC family protein n=1 Tax=Microbacterium aoyamense TaxID=344166 RepID=A0ABN2PHF4_9MICO|nr:SRPBCC domain-containing protein [Microbacterium aoyamense]